ncbi:MAG: ABC transporter permease [Planctomycetota bacterium]|nr:MAG: ABC transporter permease [Planctomycetota bacterium]
MDEEKNTQPVTQEVEAKPGRSLWGDAFHRLRKDKFAVMSFVIIVIYLFVAILSGLDWIAYNYDKQHFKRDKNGKETTELDDYSKPSLGHWRKTDVPGRDVYIPGHLLGTDVQGRDVFQRVVQGTWISLYVALIMSMIYIVIAVFLGALAGYFGGWVDDLIQWFYQTTASIPGLLLIIALTFVLGKGLGNVAIALGVVGWVGLCRLMRAEFLKHKGRDYVLAARAQGAGSFRIMFRHILPNTFHIVIISFSLGFVNAIMGEVTLTFIGLGAKPEQPSWGRMISDARAELARDPAVWWPIVGATTGMFIVCLAFNILGDALRDALDPKLKE